VLLWATLNVETHKLITLILCIYSKGIRSCVGLIIVISQHFAHHYVACVMTRCG